MKKSEDEIIEELEGLGNGDDGDDGADDDGVGMGGGSDDNGDNLHDSGVPQGQVEDDGPYQPTAGYSPGGGEPLVLPEAGEPQKTPLQQAIADIFGEYEPIASQHVELRHEIAYDGDSYEIVTLEHVVTDYSFNYGWGSGVVLFGIVMYSFFRCIGGLLKWKV